VRVVGRTDEILTFTRLGGEKIQLLPLALSTVVEETPGIRRCQIVQTGATRLEVRIEAISSLDSGAVWESVRQNLVVFLEEHRLSHVIVERSAQIPAIDPRSGKFRQVWAELREGNPVDGGSYVLS
jgi:hypothetical protein